MAKQPCASSKEQNGKSDKAPMIQANKFWVLGSLALVLIAPFFSILLAPNGRVLGRWMCDSATAYYHFVYFLGECLRNGIIPLWNPHIMLGIPFIGEGQGSAFHPLSLLFSLTRASTAVNWIVVSSFVLTGMFFFGYLRALGLSRPAAWSGAIVWSFSSAMISRIYAGHLNILLTFVSIPLLMMFWERFRNGGGIRHLVGIAFAYGMMILAFYPQMLYIFSLFFLFYVLIQSVMAVVDRSSTPKREIRAILQLSLFILLGIALGAIQLLPALDFVSRSFRQESTIEFCSMFSFPPENLLTLVAPRFFGTGLEDGPGRYWGRNLFWEMWMYIGVLPLMLAAVGVFVAPTGRRVALLGAAAIFLLFGFGKNSALYPLLYEHFPLFDVFRGSSKNTLVTLFCLVVLSAYGFEAVFGKTDQIRHSRRIVIIAGVVLLALCFGVMATLVRDAAAPGSSWSRLLVWLHQKPMEMYYSGSVIKELDFLQQTANGAGAALVRAIVLVGLSMVVVLVALPGKWRAWSFVMPIAVIVIDLFGVFMPLLRTFDKDLLQTPLVLDESAQTVYPPRILVPWNNVPNRAIRSGYSTAFGYTGNTLSRYNELISHVQFLSPNESRAESKFVQFTPHFNMLGFDAIALDDRHVPPHSAQLGKLGDKVLIPYAETNVTARRAFLAESPRYFSRREDALSYVLSNQVNVITSPAIEGSGSVLPAYPLEKDETVKFISFSPNKVEMEVQANVPRELVLCSTFEKNWMATVNGVSKRVDPANYVFRAVQVPAGTSRVIFEYRPRVFYWGAIISGGALAILLATLAGAVGRVRRCLHRSAQPPCPAPDTLVLAEKL